MSILQIIRDIDFVQVVATRVDVFHFYTTMSVLSEKDVCHSEFVEAVRGSVSTLKNVVSHTGPDESGYVTLVQGESVKHLKMLNDIYTQWLMEVWDSV